MTTLNCCRLAVTAAVMMQSPGYAQDTTVVRADNSSVWGRNVSVIREIRIGEVEGAQEYTFGRISGVAAGTDGSIFVLDQSVPVVRQYTAAGRHVRDFGKRGQGPGELSRPEVIAVSNDRLIVRDMGNKRFVVYSLTGSAPQHMDYPSNAAGQWPIIVHANNAVSNRFSVRRAADPFVPVILRYNPDGSVRDTVDIPRFAPDPPMLEVRAGGGFASYSIAYWPSAIWTYTSDHRFVGGDPSRYTVFIVDGRKVTRIDRTAKQVPVSASERAARKLQTESNIRSANNPDYKWNGPAIPSVKPFYKSLLVDGDQRIWVHLSTPSITVPPEKSGAAPLYREAVLYEVLSAGGQFLGQVRFPDTFRMHYARGDSVWGTESDELGVQYVVRYRLQGANRIGRQADNQVLLDHFSI